jgi:hypothetical protein
MALAAAPAVAQTDAPAPTRAAYGHSAVAGDWADGQADARAWIAVELAWMADPLVCPYYPTATVRGGVLEVWGHVPDEAVRARALELAAQHCRLPVEDALQVVPALARRPEPVAAETLRQAAVATLRRNVLDGRGRVEVASTPAGPVLVVRGIIRSEEGKLLVSRHLRGLPGCVAVVNLLQTTDGVVIAPPPRFAEEPTRVRPEEEMEDDPAVRVSSPRPLDASDLRQPEPVGAGPTPPDDGELGVLQVVRVATVPPRDAQPADLRDWLVWKVRQACPEATEVEVALAPGGAVAIRLHAPGNVESSQLADRLLAVNELAAYHPLLEILPSP